MATGSEQFTWKQWPYGKECSACGKTLRVIDVGEQRTYYKRGKAVKRLLLCKEHRGRTS